MKKDTFFITAIIILFIFNLLTLAYVMFGLKKDNPPFPPPHGIALEEKLQFTKEQKQQFEELKKEHRNGMSKLQSISRDLHDKYLDQLKSDAIDTTVRNSLLQQMGDNQKEMDKVTFSHFEKLRTICNPEQKKLFNSLLDEIARSLRPPEPGPEGHPPQGPPPGR